MSDLAAVLADGGVYIGSGFLILVVIVVILFLILRR